MPNVMTFDGLLVWVGALSTLALYSVLYRENPVYRFAEHVFLGLATGYGLYVVWDEILFKLWFTPLFTQHYWAWILALVAGLMYYTVYSKRFSWMSRLVMVTMMGLAAGLSFREFFGQYVPQIGASFKPLVVLSKTPAGALDPAASAFGTFTNILFVVCLLSVMTYFFFAFEQRNKAVQGTARLGRWLMMIAFGAMWPERR